METIVLSKMENSVSYWKSEIDIEILVLPNPLGIMKQHLLNRTVLSTYYTAILDFNIVTDLTIAKYQFGTYNKFVLGNEHTFIHCMYTEKTKFKGLIEPIITEHDYYLHTHHHVYLCSRYQHRTKEYTDKILSTAGKKLLTLNNKSDGTLKHDKHYVSEANSQSLTYYSLLKTNS